MPDYVREHFRKLGRKGGRRGSREDKIRAGRKGAKILLENLKKRHEAAATGPRS